MHHTCEGMWTFWRMTIWLKVQFGEINLTKSTICQNIFVEWQFNEYKFAEKTVWRDKFDEKINLTNICREKYNSTKYFYTISNISSNCPLSKIFLQIVFFIKFFRQIVLFVKFFSPNYTFRQIYFAKLYFSSNL